MFEDISEQILSQISQWATIYETVIGWVVPLVVLGLTVNLMWHGFLVMKGEAGLHVLDVFAKSIRAFLVVSLALAGGAYASNVMGFFIELRTSFVGLFSGAPAGMNSYAALDVSVDKAVTAMNSQLPWVAANTNILIGNFTGLIGLGSMGFMVGCLVIYSMISAVNLLLVDFSFAIIWAVGPMAVAGFAFPATARFFDAWLGAVLKYTMTSIVISAVAGLGNSILEVYCSNIAQNADKGLLLKAAFSALAASGILIILLVRVPSIAGDIVGGIGISLAASPGSAVGPLSAASQGMKSGARAGANAGSYLLGKLMGPKERLPGQGQGQAESGSPPRSPTPPSLGQRAIAASAQFARATTNMGSGSVGAAYNAGAAGGGTGVVTGSQEPRTHNARPLHPPTR